MVTKMFNNMTRLDKVRWISGGGAVAALLLLLYMGHKPTPPVVTHLTPNTTVVSVPKVTKEVITTYVNDPAQQVAIASLMAENKRLKLEVISLTSTVASLHTSGGVGINGGTIVPLVVGLPKTSMVIANEPTQPPIEYNFKDHQLSAKFSGKPSFTYTLDQKFSIIGSHGVGEGGKAIDLVSLYQNTPKGLVKVDTQTLAFEGTPTNLPRWFGSPRIQGGVGFPKSGVVALEWLRHGTGPEAEHTTYSLFSPALTFNGEGAKLGIIPININLGQIKYLPFTNLWIGPTVGIDKTVGGAITATF